MIGPLSAVYHDAQLSTLRHSACYARCRRMRPCPPPSGGTAFMATSTRASAGASDLLKWSFFAVMALGALLVVWTDERFWLNPADPHWNHIAHVEGLLAVHGLGGVTALLAGAVQMSSRIRSDRPALHRALGKIYIAAVSISAPVAIYMGTSTLEPVSIRFEQIFQGGFWLFSALVA